jgi:hypothetical protein
VHDHRRPRRLRDDPQRRQKGLAPVLGEVQVPVRQPPRVRDAGGPVDRLPIDVVEHQVPVVEAVPFGHPAELLHLGRTPQVDHRAHAELRERRRVVVADAVQRVRAEEPPPAHGAPVEPLITADVAEVVGSGETKIPGV